MVMAPKNGNHVVDVSSKTDDQLAWKAKKLTEVAIAPTKPLPTTNNKICLGSMIDHSCSVGVEKVYEMVNIEMMMTEMHGC